MATLLRKGPGLIQNNSVLIQSKRFRGKINIQKPRAPHFEKARVLKLTEPFYPSKKKDLSLVELCGKMKPKIDRASLENPFQKILAKECLNWFNHSRLIILYHINPMSADEKFNAYVAFKKNNMHIKEYGLKTLKMALDGTKYEPFTHHYVSHNMILFSPEPNIKQVLKLSKKIPQIVLLSAVYEGKFVSKDELLVYAQIGDIQMARAAFVQTLQNAGGQLVRRITQQQDTLVNRLQDRADQLKGT
ncbi:mitochondrial ribosomal protein L10 [Carabus blaptoides fortunei]